MAPKFHMKNQNIWQGSSGRSLDTTSQHKMKTYSERNMHVLTLQGNAALICLPVTGFIFLPTMPEPFITSRMKRWLCCCNQLWVLCQDLYLHWSHKAMLSSVTGVSMTMLLQWSLNSEISWFSVLKIVSWPKRRKWLIHSLQTKTNQRKK